MKGLDFVKLMYQGINYMRMKSLEVKTVPIKEIYTDREEESKIHRDSRF